MEKEEKKYPIGGYAPGNYHCICINCNETFSGDKRAVQCEPCATETLKEMEKEEVKVLEQNKLIEDWAIQTAKKYNIHLLDVKDDQIISYLAQKELTTPPNLDNLLELAREEAERRFKDNEIWHKRELYEALFKQGAEFIIDKLKELGKQD